MISIIGIFRIFRLRSLFRNETAYPVEALEHDDAPHPRASYLLLEAFLDGFQDCRLAYLPSAFDDDDLFAAKPGSYTIFVYPGESYRKNTG
jgi:hypothetical protein